MKRQVRGKKEPALFVFKDNKKQTIQRPADRVSWCTCLPLIGLLQVAQKKYFGVYGDADSFHG